MTTSTNRHLGYVLKRFPRISETFIAREVIELARQGERVTVFAVSKPDEPFEHGFIAELDRLGVEVVYLPHRPLGELGRVASALSRVVRAEPRGWGKAARVTLWPPRLVGLRRLSQASVLRDELARRNIDHMHAHFATAAARLANLAWRMGGPSYSVTTHAKDLWHDDVQPEHLRDKLMTAAFVATVTEENERLLRSVLAGSVRVERVANSVDTSILQPRDPTGIRGRRVLTVARLVEKKGLDDLIAACAELVRRDRPVLLDVVGEGVMRGTLEAAAVAAGVDVMFHGALPHEEVVQRFAEADVFALPCVVAATGDRDGLPSSVLEAMALGVPVVTTAVNGLREAVRHEETGMLVPPRDPCALADAIDRVLTDSALAMRLVGAARQHVEVAFSLSTTVSHLRTLFPAVRPVVR